MEQTDARSESRFQRWRSWGPSILGRCPGLAVNAAPLALNRYRRGRRRLLVSIGREVGSRLFPRTRTRNSRILAGSSGSARRFHVRSALARWHLCSRLQRLLLRPLPLSLRSITSYCESLVDQNDGWFCGHVFWGEAFRRSSLHPPPKLKEAML